MSTTGAKRPRHGLQPSGTKGMPSKPSKMCSPSTPTHSTRGAKRHRDQIEAEAGSRTESTTTLAFRLIELSTDPNKRAGVNKIAELIRFTEVLQQAVRQIQEAPQIQRHARAYRIAGELLRVKEAIEGLQLVPATIQDVKSCASSDQGAGDGM